jgi:integrase/recombinase XerD
VIVKLRQSLREVVPLPKVKKDPWSAWSAYRLDAAPPARPDDIALVRRYIALRRLAHGAKYAGQEERWLVRWICHLAQRGKRLADADTDDALAITELFDELTWAVASRRKFIGSLRKFHEWLVDQEKAERNPWRQVKPPRAEEKIPRVLPPAEQVRILEAANRPTWRDVRDRALVAVLQATGCRLSEVLDAQTGDLDLQAMTLRVTGKGRRERIAFLDDIAAGALRVYLDAVRPFLASSPAGPIFLGRHGRRMHPDVARDALRRLAARAGIRRHVWPHLLRHSLATEMLENGADIRHVQEILGHRSIRSTQRYTHVAPSRLREVYDRTHRAHRVRAAGADGDMPDAAGQ